MPGKKTKETMTCQYFTWLLGKRNEVWQADGRSNKVDLGRNSLGTYDYEEAKQLVHELDRIKAVEYGFADRSILVQSKGKQLSLENGRKLYSQHSERPRIVGGVKPATLKRYRAVFDKFLEFTETERLKNWNQISKDTLVEYAKHLENKKYAPRSIYLELNTIKQAIKWFVKNDHLPAGHEITLKIKKPEGTSTYCWRVEEVQAMINHCSQHPELEWMRHIIVALAFTGLRISELRDLRWSNVNIDKSVIYLVDETGQDPKKNQDPRTTKSGHNRILPIHPKLFEVLEMISRHSDGHIFHGPKGGRLKPDTVRRILVRDVIEVLSHQFPELNGEIGFVDGRLHSFRHFFCSQCANQGIAQQVVMQWLGHSESKMVQHYYHLHDEESRRQMNRLDWFTDSDDDVIVGN